MPRTPFRLLVLLLAFVSSPLLLVACGGTSAEQQVLNNFFRASRVRDNTTLANISAVSLDPRTDGSVQSFTITSMGQEQRRQLQIQQLMDEEAKAKAEEVEVTKRKREYQTANMPALERVSKAQHDGQVIRGADAELVTSWTKVNQEQSQSQRRLSQVRSKLNGERNAAINSLSRPGESDLDISGMEVELVTKDVTVDTQLRTPGGETVARTMVLTLQRAVGKKDGQSRDGRWLIVKMQQQGAAKTT